MQRFTLEFATEGNNDVINVSPELQKRLADLRVSGLVHLFVVGSTAAITTMTRPRSKSMLSRRGRAITARDWSDRTATAGVAASCRFQSIQRWPLPCPEETSGRPRGPAVIDASRLEP